jgi:hypothetical protein
MPATPCFGVEVDDEAEDQHDQPEQTAEHDELTHDHDPSDAIKF